MDYSPQVTLGMRQTVRKIYESIQSKAIRLAIKWPCHMTYKAMLETNSKPYPKGLNIYLIVSLIKNEIKSYNIAPFHKKGLFCKLKIRIRLHSEYLKKLPSTFKAIERFK
jgi:hypothetical protein